jgi:hypothetical protein
MKNLIKPQKKQKYIYKIKILVMDQLKIIKLKIVNMNRNKIKIIKIII